MADFSLRRCRHYPGMRIVIDIDEDVPPIGRVLVGTDPPHEFAGWLALLRLLDDALGNGAAAAPEALAEPLPPG